MPRTRPALTLMLAMSALSVASCNRGAGGATAVVVIGDDQPKLGDPLKPPAGTAAAVLRLAIAQGLVRFDPSGQIEPGLAERWNVSDDGLSYIFRLSTGEWPDGRKIVAKDIARQLTREMKAGDDDSVRDSLGAVSEIVAMTDRVIEIRLISPRPNLLTLLAQPEFPLIRDGAGTGPFHIREPKTKPADAIEPSIALRRRLPGIDGDEGEKQDVTLAAMPAAKAIAAFVDDRAAVVLGGTVNDLPLATGAKLPRGTLRFDPAAGLFGLVPARADGIAGDTATRRLLAQALDRGALIAQLAVPGLVPRATLLQDGLAGIGTLPQPAWLTQPAIGRRPSLLADAAQLQPAKKAGAPAEPRKILVALPDGPGADIILARLQADWGPIGFQVARAGKRDRPDIRWVDEVAPSDSPAWFLRHFRCGSTPVCLHDADALLDQARIAVFAVQRAALFGEVARMMDAEQLFIPVAAPIRWSLVDKSAPGFVENRYARHTLAGLGLKPRPGDGS